MFFIIWGTTHLKKKLTELLAGCPVCDRIVQMEVYKRSKWGHIFWIPIIKFFGSDEITIKCSCCKKEFYAPRYMIEAIMDKISEERGE